MGEGNTAEYKFAEVAVPIETRYGDHCFTYRIPCSLADRVKVGSWVKVPFRRAFIHGWVVKLSCECSIDDVKEIDQVLSDYPAFTKELFELSRWIADTYLCPLGIVLRSLSPVWLGQAGADEMVEFARLAIAPEEGPRALEAVKRAPKQTKVLRKLLDHGGSAGLPVKQLLEELIVDRPVLRNLAGRGFIVLSKERWKDLPDSLDPGLKPAGAAVAETGPDRLILNPQQRTALAEIKEAILSGEQRAFLLHGVTGSGKTEIYLRAIAATLKRGRQAIFLVPEIALTPQMVAILKERFGSDVAVLHSRLTHRERSLAWRRLSGGKARVAVGARSVVFAPVPNLGLIVIDEEQENSYKQEAAPRYHTRDVAFKRAQLTSSVLVLGSATPSLETYHRAQRGGLRILSLDERVDGKELPPVTIVDMREELRREAPRIFSRLLQDRIDAVMARGEQVLLFLNRRGYHAFLVCRSCGEVLRCRSCDVTLTLHRDRPLLRCHYCGFHLSRPPVCPVCGASRWLGQGSGTQKVEEDIARQWPSARVLRLDADVAKNRRVNQEVYECFRKGEADILVGTQMVAKGFNFPHLTLVGVINADVTLNLPDFRARERTFQLLTQVAGRAGRGDRPGEVVVQTFFPQDFSVLTARDHDFQTFFGREMECRRRHGYPPFGYLILILVASPREERAREVAKEVHGLASRHDQTISVLGPAPAPLARLEGQFRYQVILKGRSFPKLHAIAKQTLAGLEKRAQVRITVDVNPLFMM